MRKYTTEKNTQQNHISRTNTTKTYTMALPFDGSKSFQDLKQELLNNVVSTSEGAQIIGGSNFVGDVNNSGCRDIIPQ